MKYRSNSHQKFSSEKLQNNNIPQYKSNYNIPNEEIKQSSFESNLLNDVDSNINILLSNLKNNNSPKRKIYFPLNSKTKSPIKVPSTNDITELNLIDEFNSLVENNSYRSNNYLYQDNSSYQNNIPSNHSYINPNKNMKNPTIIINNSNNIKQNINNNETNNKRMNNRSYSSYELNNINQNYNNKVNLNRINNYERNINLFKKNQNLNNMKNTKSSVVNNINQNIGNNIKPMSNNINYATSPTNKQINQIMNQINI